MTEQATAIDSGNADSAATDSVAASVEIDPVAAHRAAQRRLLFGIELTLFALVLLIAMPGNAVAGVIVAFFGLLMAVSGL